MSRTIRLCLVLLALTLLAGGTAQAMPPGAHLQPAAPGGPLQSAWEWITGLFMGGEGQEPAALWDKAGCEMDPDGLLGFLFSANTGSSDPSTAETGIGLDFNS
ncbi:MAG TPA: hypothetical protein VMW27_29785 [Thermoanaerobaculia bacterium]|nr:hypothetical protein [Thermoanaerobaculia bacterium]